jgi:transposase
MTTTGTPALHLCVGLDWATEKHALTAYDLAGQVVARFEVPATPEGYAELVHRLRTLGGSRPVGLCLEASRGPLFSALLPQEFLYFYPLNPKCASRLRELFKADPGKTDPTDADLLGLFLVHNWRRLRPWGPEDPLTRRLQTLVDFEQTWLGRQTALTNQLRARLLLYFPQALAVSADLDSPLVLEFLRRWPSLAAAQGAGGGLRRLFAAHLRDPAAGAAQVEALRQAQPLTTDPAIVEPLAEEVQALVAALGAGRERLAQLRRQIDQLFDQHPDAPLFKSFPGVGPKLGPRLLAYVGTDRARFATAGDLLAFGGAAPVTEASGKKRGKHRLVRRRRGCHKALRHTLHLWARASVQRGTWAHALFTHGLEQGMKRPALYRVLAYKWGRILFACWQHRTPYDPDRYHQALREHGSWLAAELAPVPAAAR